MSPYPWKRWAITALGCFILGIGIGFCDLSKLGTDPFTVLLVGMHVQLGGTIGLMNILVNIFMILFFRSFNCDKFGFINFKFFSFRSFYSNKLGFLFDFCLFIIDN